MSASAPMLQMAVDKGDVIKICFEKNKTRYYWIAVTAFEDGLLSIMSDDLRIDKIWERKEDELPEAEI